jgi:hypothetical protein
MDARLQPCASVKLSCLVSKVRTDPYFYYDPLDFTDPMGLLPDALAAEVEARDVAPAVVLASGATIAVAIAPAAIEGAGAVLTRAAIAFRYGGPAALATKMGLNNATKLQHIFNAREGHTPPSWKEFGSITRAAQELAKATQAAVRAQGTKNGNLDVTIKFGQQTVKVTGIVKDGLAQVGTAFVPKGVPPVELR